MRNAMMAMIAAVMLASAAPAAAQNAVENRVDRLEREMRAVQRKVFPGGTGATLEPQITAPQTATDIPVSPAGSPITDLTARVSALETNIRSITGQVEQDGYRIRQLEETFNAYKIATDARLKALEDATAAPALGAPAATATPRQTTPRSTPPRAVATAADPDREAAVTAIEQPASDDPAEDGYTYGYRLWEAKLYPEAEAALKTVADRYPKHRRASYAQNLLGRAYLDEGKPSLASLAFYDSYKKFPEGARAPDSLLYLAQALVKLKKPAADVCKVYSELTDVYGEKLSSTMKADVEKGRAVQKCK